MFSYEGHGYNEGSFPDCLPTRCSRLGSAGEHCTPCSCAPLRALTSPSGFCDDMLNLASRSAQAAAATAGAYCDRGPARARPTRPTRCSTREPQRADGAAFATCSMRCSRSSLRPLAGALPRQLRQTRPDRWAWRLRLLGATCFRRCLVRALPRRRRLVSALGARHSALALRLLCARSAPLRLCTSAPLPTTGAHGIPHESLTITIPPPSPQRSARYTRIAPKIGSESAAQRYTRRRTGC